MGAENFGNSRFFSIFCVDFASFCQIILVSLRQVIYICDGLNILLLLACLSIFSLFYKGYSDAVTGVTGCDGFLYTTS